VMLTAGALAMWFYYREAAEQAKTLAYAERQAVLKEGLAREAERSAHQAATDARAAQHRSDEDAARLQLTAGRKRAEAGHVEHGLFLMIDALQRTPSEATALRRAIRANIAAWSWCASEVLWARDTHAHNMLIGFADGDRTIVVVDGQQLRRFDAKT